MRTTKAQISLHIHSLISTFVVHFQDNNTATCYIQNVKTLASFWSWAGWFGSYLVENPKDRISGDETRIYDPDLCSGGRNTAIHGTVFVI